MDKTYLIFNLHKDDVIKDCKKFKSKIIRKYNLTNEEANEIFIMIVNYQIDTYGVQIGVTDELYDSYEERKRKFENAKRRKQYRQKAL